MLTFSTAIFSLEPSKVSTPAPHLSVTCTSILFSFSALVCLHLVSVWRAGQNDNKWILGDFTLVQIRGEEQLSVH